MPVKKTQKKTQRAGRTQTKKGKSRRSGRGLFADLGSNIPIIGRPIGQWVDNAVNGAIGNAFGKANIAAPGKVYSHQANSTREVGTEQLTSFTVPALAPAGSVMLRLLIAAPEMGTRLADMAKLWTKTRFNKFEVEIVSANSSLVPGNYTMAIDPDPVADYESGPDVVSRLMALTNATQANAWSGAHLAMKTNRISLFNRFNPLEATDAELREYACGQLLIALTTDYSEECTYTVHIHWDVEFERPDTVPKSDVAPTGYTISGLEGSIGVCSSFDPFLNNPVLTFTDASAWLHPSPDEGIYSVQGLGIGWKLDMVTPATFVPVYLTVEMVGTTLTASFSCKYTGYSYNGGAGVVGPNGQTPAIFNVPLFSPAALGTTTVGLSKMSSFYARHGAVKEQRWNLRNIRKTDLKKEIQLLEQESARRALESMTVKTDHEVAEELNNLRSRLT